MASEKLILSHVQKLELANSINNLVGLNIPFSKYHIADECTVKETEDKYYVVIKDCDERLFSIADQMMDATIELMQNPIIHVGGLMVVDEMMGLCEIGCFINYPKKWYELYLQSEQWRSFKNSIIKDRGFNCELCTSKKNIQLHHLTYERLGKERQEDVMILCQKCHGHAHKKN